MRVVAIKTHLRFECARILTSVCLLTHAYTPSAHDNAKIELSILTLYIFFFYLFHMNTTELIRS